MPGISVRFFRKGIRALEREVELALISQTECCGITPAQCHLLLAVEEAIDPSIGEIAAALELDASTLSRTVDSLVKTELLSRREDPANRRRQLIALTEAGREKARAINTLCDRYYEGLLAALPPHEAETIVHSIPFFVDSMREWRRSQLSVNCGETPGGSL